MVAVSLDDDGTLIVSIPPGHPARERILIGLLSDDVAAEGDAPAPDGEAPSPKPPRKSRGGEPTQRILDILRDIAPCSPSALWKRYGARNYDALGVLIDDGKVVATGSTNKRVLSLP